MSQMLQCQAFTKDGKGPQCSRNAVFGEIYCTQHLKIYGSQKKSPKQSPKQSPALIPDITKNILSEYLEYQEAKDLESQNLDIYANPKRIEIKKNLIDAEGLKYDATYIDGELIKEEGWWKNGNAHYIENFKNDKLEGKQYYYYPNEKLYSELNYKNGKLQGLQYVFDKRGNLTANRNYDDDIEI